VQIGAVVAEATATLLAMQQAAQMEKAEVVAVAGARLEHDTPRVAVSLA
jgi:hypothetical protein